MDAPEQFDAPSEKQKQGGGKPQHPKAQGRGLPAGPGGGDRDVGQAAAEQEGAKGERTPITFVTMKIETRVDGASMGAQKAVAARKGAVNLSIGKFAGVDVVFIDGPTVKIPVMIPMSNVASFG